MQATLIRHDTKAWKAQVWISFFVAAALCAIGLAWLPGRDLDRAFMMMGYMFCLSAAFALAKFVRDNERARGRHAALAARRLGRLRAGDGADRLGPGADGDQPGLQGLPRRRLAVPDLELRSRSPRRCATRTTTLLAEAAQRAVARSAPRASASESRAPFTDRSYRDETV